VTGRRGFRNRGPGAGCGSGGAEVKEVFGEVVNPGRQRAEGGCGEKSEGGEGHEQGGGGGPGAGLRMDEAMDADGEVGAGGGERGTDIGCAGGAGIGGASGQDERVGKEEGAVGIPADGIVIGGPVGSILPGLAEGISAGKARMEAREKSEGEEFPVVAVPCVGALVGEGEIEGGERDAARSIEEAGRDEDERAQKSDEADREAGIGNGEDGDITGGEEKLAGAAAGAGVAAGAEGEGESAEQSGSEPESDEGCDEEAQGADAFRLAIGFAVEPGGETESAGDEDGDESRADLEEIKDALAPARGGGVEGAENPAGREGEGDLRCGEDEADGEGENAEQAQGIGEGHRGSPLRGVDWGGAEPDWAEPGCAELGCAELGCAGDGEAEWARAVRMLDSS
jgi:hypothetical protein